MSEQTETENLDALRGSSREAERLIEQRIEELRAAALDPISDLRPWEQQQAAPPTPSNPFGHDAVLMPSRPLPPQPQAPDPGALEAIQRSVARIERELLADVTRMEELLQSWGSGPDESLRQQTMHVHGLLEQLQQGISRQLTQVGTAVLARVDARSNIEPLIEAMARWSVELQTQTEQQARVLQAQIQQLESANTTDRDAQFGQLIENAVRTSGAAFDTRLSVLVGELRTQLEQAEGRAVELRESTNRHVDEAAERVLRSVGDSLDEVQRSIERTGTRARTAGIELGEVVEQRFDKHDASWQAWSQAISKELSSNRELIEGIRDDVLRRLEEQNEEINAQERRERSQGEQLTSKLNAQERRITDLLVQTREHLEHRFDDQQQSLVDSFAKPLAESSAQLEQILAGHTEPLTASIAQLEQRIDGQTKPLEAAIAQLEQRLVEHTKPLSESLEQLEQTLAARQDKLEAAIAQLEQQAATPPSSLMEGLRAVAAAIEAVDERHKRDAETSRKLLRTEIASVREDLATELEPLRSGVANVRKGLASELEPVRAEIEGVREGVLSEIAGVRDGVLNEIAPLRGEIAQVRDGVHNEIAPVRAEVAGVRDEMLTEIGQLRVTAAQDTELLFDTVGGGWMSMQELLSAMDDRVARLEALLDSDQF